MSRGEGALDPYWTLELETAYLSGLWERGRQDPLGRRGRARPKDLGVCLHG